jgi:radical SAM superfamily enzyme YgiQ (UPF0313 family)
LNQKILLIAPPFSQLNTPYPAIGYLKGFLEYKAIPSSQVDLGIEVLLQIFSKKGLNLIFDSLKAPLNNVSENSLRIIALKKHYINTVDDVISYLQGKDDMLAHIISDGSFLPQASRFNHIEDIDWAFGNMGIRDKARYLCTLYLEDISDLIVECIDPHFGFSRYAERLSSSAYHFDPIYEELLDEDSLIIEIQNKLLKKYIEDTQPTLVAISIPFPGNLFSALKCGQYIRKNYPEIKICMGGGYPNTELRSISDSRFFKFTDFITLDDGETPLFNIIEYLNATREKKNLKRTFLLEENTIRYIDGSQDADLSLRVDIAPSYEHLDPNKYLSVIELINPMHRLWSDGFWNKLTMAHGCYWGRCTFCDTTLDYIKRFEPVSAKTLCNKVEKVMTQTGKKGFHFVDEAAPPALMISFAKEVIKRGLNITWWTNIRFEKQFTFDVCTLLKESGCIAVSGGLEVASDRILSLINKGVSVSKVAEVCHNFTCAGIMTHAYLMYGFPTQTAKETIDSLEVVRQLFENNVLQSGFWHQFAMTAHSPVGKNPDKFKVETKNKTIHPFANNDLEHTDKQGAVHYLFSDGLKKSLYNFMHDVGFDLPLQTWFDFKVPLTTISPDFIYNTLEQKDNNATHPNKSVLWIYELPHIRFYKRKKKGKTSEFAELTIYLKNDNLTLNVKENIGKWLMNILAKAQICSDSPITYSQMEDDFIENKLGDFSVFCKGHTFKQLRENGLLIL